MPSTRPAEQTNTRCTRPSRYAVAYGEPGPPGAAPLPCWVADRSGDSSGAGTGRAHPVLEDRAEHPYRAVDGDGMGFALRARVPNPLTAEKGLLSFQSSWMVILRLMKLGNGPLPFQHATATSGLSVLK